MANRHVPVIYGVVCLGISAALILGVGSWWAWIIGMPIGIFGWMSLKLGFSASDDEVATMTSMEPMPMEMKDRIRDQISGAPPPTAPTSPAIINPDLDTHKSQQVRGQVPYQVLVLEIVDGAMAIDVFDGEAFNNLPINRLEATMSTLWMITRTFYGLKDDRCFDMAAKFAVHSVLEMVSGEYSEQEFARIVMPTYKRRMDQYNEMFTLGPSEAAQAPLMRVCKQIVENVCGEEEAHIAQIMAVMLVGWETTSMIGKKILTLEKAGRVDWTSSDP